MRFISILGNLLSLHLYITGKHRYSVDAISFEINADSDPHELSNQCPAEFTYCKPLIFHSTQLYQHHEYNLPLNDWTYHELCRCYFPPASTQHKLEKIQFLHFPKCGTSINYFLHDYFDNCSSSDVNPLLNSSSSDNTSNIKNDKNISIHDNEQRSPCPIWLDEVGTFFQGLCNGRLFSCNGHYIPPDFVTFVQTKRTSIVTLLRHPYNRLYSQYYHYLTYPTTKLLEPSLSTAYILNHSNTFVEFIHIPGIHNCMTKMLNGIPCGANIEIHESQLEVAKDILLRFVYIGITEYFKTSICMMSWLYGGNVKPLHFQSYRKGSYKKNTIEIILNETERESFYRMEYYDLQLYDYAKTIFLQRLHYTNCPIID